MAAEDLELHELVKLLDRVRQWAELIEGSPQAWHAQPGSILADDDGQTAPYHLSHSVWHALTVAVDHARCLRSSLIGQPGENRTSIPIYSHAQSSLVRGAIENAARAVWMVGSTTRVTRVTRRLAQEMMEIRRSYHLRDLVGGKPPKRTKEEREEQLRTIALAAGVPEADVKRALKWPTYGEIVREAGDLIKLGADAAEAAWSGCSALGHGDFSGTLSLLEREVVATNRGVNTARVTGSIALLHQTTLVAVLMIDRAFQLYHRRATASAPFSCR